MQGTVGFIGAGNMAQALIRGVISAGLLQPQQIVVSNRSQEKLNALAADSGIIAAGSNPEVVRQADRLVLAVKPQVAEAVMREIGPLCRPEQVLISIVTGLSLQRLAELTSPTQSAVRVMPNTPALCGAGMSAVTPNAATGPQQLSDVLELFQACGAAEVVSEQLMDVVTGVSGSSPAYVFMFIEAMADAAVRGGMPRAQAYRFCAQAVRGAACMVLETGEHPGKLKDQVCSPGGTTIEAVTSLEHSGFRSSVMEAVAACIRKAESIQA
ncbi:pyrroline-5-carboxylate reductase [Oscillospiraceae bacterium HV4-5-C5C]|nr:pyrroline-5-carboxylate reductase [Oscillospiraceae bacterium HV4-5-C5C]